MAVLPLSKDSGRLFYVIKVIKMDAGTVNSKAEFLRICPDGGLQAGMHKKGLLAIWQS
jgi:hypothetical protein